MEDSKLELPKAMNTMGGVEKYAYCFQMTKSEIINMLKDKTILDLGSGLGGFAKEVAINSISAKVYSVNPKSFIESTRNKERAYTSSIVENDEDRTRVQKVHDQLLTSALGSNLPFKDGSFDIVFDVMAVTHYSNDEGFQKAIDEMYRVTKKGGQILIYADFGSEFDNEKQFINKRSILKQKGIQFKELRENGYGLPQGFKITKPA